MIQCGKCRFWHPEKHRKEDYGMCECKEATAKAIADMRHAHKFQERHQYELERLYNPHVTDKWHRCMYGEARD